MSSKSLDHLRRRIDAIDMRILAALKERLSVARHIAQVKSSRRLPLTDRARETAIIAALRAAAHEPLLEDFIDALYHDIFSFSKAQQTLSRSSTPSFQRVGFIGMGLMGGSIAKTIRATKQHFILHAFDDGRRDVRTARKGGWIDHTHHTLVSLARAVDLLVLALPIDHVALFAERLARIPHDQDVIVIDVASVKGTITQMFRTLTTRQTEFIPTHPMGGSEKTGFNASRANLIVHLPWIVTPHPKNTPAGRRRLRYFIHALGGQYREMDADTHDHIIASVSHLMFLISTYLYGFAYERKKPGLALAGSGFESMTRLASANPEMHASIYQENREAILKALGEFQSFIKRHPLSAQSSLRFFKKYKAARDRQYSK